MEGIFFSNVGESTPTEELKEWDQGFKAGLRCAENVAQRASDLTEFRELLLKEISSMEG